MNPQLAEQLGGSPGHMHVTACTCAIYTFGNTWTYTVEYMARAYHCSHTPTEQVDLGT